MILKIRVWSIPFMVPAPGNPVIRVCAFGGCSNRLVPSVRKEWREPKHEAFETRNVWSLFNSFTEALKEGNLNELPKRTETLHGLLDVAVGLH